MCTGLESASVLTKGRIEKGGRDSVNSKIVINSCNIQYRVELFEQLADNMLHP